MRIACIDLIDSLVRGLRFADRHRFRGARPVSWAEPLKAALATDFILAEENARFAMPEIAFNTFPGMGAVSSSDPEAVGPLSRKKSFLTAECIRAARCTISKQSMSLASDGEIRSATLAWMAKGGEAAWTRRRILAEARRRAAPVTREELIRITDLWAECSTRISDADLRHMERLVRAQSSSSWLNRLRKAKWLRRSVSIRGVKWKAPRARSKSSGEASAEKTEAMAEVKTDNVDLSRSRRNSVRNPGFLSCRHSRRHARAHSRLAIDLAIDVYLQLIILMSGMAAYRISVLLAYTRQPPAQRRKDARRWELRYAIGAVGFMTAVGVTAAILFVRSPRRNARLLRRDPDDRLRWRASEPQFRQANDRFRASRSGVRASRDRLSFLLQLLVLGTDACPDHRHDLP